MSQLDFGTHVQLSHVVRPIYVKWQTKKLVARAPTGSGPFQMMEEVDVPGELVSADEFRDCSLGLPLPNPSDDPSRPNQTARRLRRFPCKDSGIVVGRTYRIEGDYHKGGGYSAWDGDYDPSFLVESRRLQVFQVAVGESWPDLTAWPARIEIAIATDMEVR